MLKSFKTLESYIMHSEAAILILLGHFIFVVIGLTIFWRIAVALDSIAKSLSELVKDGKKSLSDEKKG